MDASRESVRDRAEALRQRAVATRTGRLALEARSDDLGVHLLAVTAQQLLCVVPFAVALAAVGRRLGDVSIADVLAHVLALGPGADRLVQQSFGDSAQVGTVALWTNLGIAVAFGVGFAASVQRALEMMWRLPRAAAASSAVRQAYWALALPVVVTAVVVLGRITHQAGGDAAVASGFAGQVLTVAVFVWWTHRLLLPGRVGGPPLAVAACVATAALAAILIGARWLVSGQLESADRAYGTVGVFVVLSAWIGVASTATVGALATIALRYRDALHGLPAG